MSEKKICDAPWCKEERDADNPIGNKLFCGWCWYRIMNGLVPSFMLEGLFDE